MSQPRTWYTQAGDVNIGYQVVGEGPVDLILVWGLNSNIEVMWEEPSFAAFLRRLSEFSRLIVYDRRGCGVSDRQGNTVTPTLEERMEDILAVLDATGSQRAALLGVSEGGNLAALFAATHPHRTRRLVLYAAIARFIKDADHRWGFLDEREHVTFLESVRAGWGLRSRRGVQLWAPSMAGDDHFLDWFAKWGRQSVSRGAISPLMWALIDYDTVDVFPAVRIPTLVLHRRDDALLPVAQSRWIADQVPDARLVELSGIDHLPFVGDAEEILAEVEDFLLGSRGAQPRHRRLLTVLVTDIADSAAHLSRLGDHAWRELLAAHDRELTAHLSRYGGQEVKRLGDGCLAVFDGPAKAIRCAQGIVHAGARLGLSTRVGLHCGECEVDESEVRGIAVHVAGEVLRAAAGGQVLVSSTVRDLVAGSGIRFDEGRPVELHGFPGPQTVSGVIMHGATPDEVRRLTIDGANALRRDGEYWTVAYDGRVVTLRDSKGLHDLARLLAAGPRELHVLDLANEGSYGVANVPARPLRDAGLHVDGGVGDPVIDDAARTAYRQRIADLDEAVDDAEARGDPEARARALEERDALVAELAAAYGFGGRPRRTPGEIERARKRVSRRIHDALRRIDRQHPSLGRHLRASLQLGIFCSYQPERLTTWTADDGARPMSPLLSSSQNGAVGSASKPTSAPTGLLRRDDD